MTQASESTFSPYSDSLVRRSNILQAIIRLSNEHLSGLNRNELLLRCAEILFRYSSFNSGWIGRHVPETGEITPLAFLKTGAGNGDDREISRKLILLDGAMVQSIQETAESGKPALFTDIDPPVTLPLAPERVTFRSCSIWPLSHHDFVYGVVAIFSEQPDGFPPDELKFLEATMAD
ncbi:MAG: GAF domain-containing protein, partial [Desulfofustis sp.]|nr:GAF domain-containing protein [Desulfofustis sp.]